MPYRDIVTAVMLIGAAGAGHAAAIPTVGCAADGQMGPVAKSHGGAVVPAVAGRGAAGLAYYFLASETTGPMGVLAPRGWHCFGLYGSAATILIVTPERHGAADLFAVGGGLKGPAVQLSYVYGDTSGRFEVAQTIARVFPAYTPIVDKVVAEGIWPRSEFPKGPYPADQLTRQGDRSVYFVTPANMKGMGTQSRLVCNGTAIAGYARLTGEPAFYPDKDIGLTEVVVRLPPDQQALSAAIIGQVAAAAE